VLQHRQNRADRLHEYLLFSLDPTEFKKYKNKQMQGVHYTRDAQGSYKTQTFVMSTFIYGQSCVPFKKILYWGRKVSQRETGVQKSDLFEISHQSREG